MIQKVGDYYSCEEDLKSVSQLNDQLNQERQAHTKYYAQGSTKEMIQAIRQRFQTLRKLQNQDKNKQLNKNGQSIFSNMSVKQQDQSCSNLQIQIYIPEQILQIDTKISALQQKLNPNQVFRQKIEKKGPLIERIRILQQKFQKIVQKSSQLVIANIQNYCSSLDEKQQYLKILYLREAITKTEGLKEQIKILQTYLTNLDRVQTKIKSIEPLQKSIKNHQQILEHQKRLSEKIKNLFQKMKSQYEAICKQIDSLNI